MDHYGNTGTYCSQITDDKVSGDIRLDKLLPLLGVFNRKAPPKNLPPVDPIPPCKRDGVGKFTFGSFNDVTKLSDETLLMWVEILHHNPDAQIVLKHQSFSREDRLGPLSVR